MAWLESAVAAMPESCVQSAGAGEYVAFRAKASNGTAIPVVYSLGWTPSREAPQAAARAIRVEYLFSPYKPNQAILTEADMLVSNVVSVTTYVVADHLTSLGVVMAARDRALGDHRAASTLVTVPALARPEWQMEIAVVAVA